MESPRTSPDDGTELDGTNEIVHAYEGNRDLTTVYFENKRVSIYKEYEERIARTDPNNTANVEALINEREELLEGLIRQEDTVYQI